MKKLFTLTSDNGDKLKIRLERNDDLSWTLDAIAPSFGCSTDCIEVGDIVYHVRDKYCFQVTAEDDYFLSSYKDNRINRIYCRLATAEDISTHQMEVTRRKHNQKTI